jgi:hypothetical protein
MKLSIPQPHHLKQAGVTAALFSMVAVVESKSMMGAYHAQLDPTNGLQMAALSALAATLAFAGFNIAGSFKDDIRHYVRRRVFAVRAVAIAFLLIPIGFLGSSLKMDRLDAFAAAYENSDAQRADAILASDMMADRYDRAAARDRLSAQPTPDLSLADGEFWIALFILGVLNFAADALRIPAPVTAEEAAHIRKLEIAAKGQATKRRNKAAREAKKRAAAAPPKRFRLLAGGK